MVVHQDITQSIDMATLSIVQWVEQNSSVDGKPVHTSEKQILDWPKLTLTKITSVNMAAPTCTTEEVLSYWDNTIGVIERFWYSYTNSYSRYDMITCSKHQNGLDWYDINFPPHDFPLTLSYRLHETRGVDEEGLLHSLEVEGKTYYGNVTSTTRTEVESVRPGGPKAEDFVVPSACHQAQPPHAGFVQEDIAV